MSGDKSTSDTLTPSQQVEPWGKLLPCLPSLDSTILCNDSVKIGRTVTCDIVIDRSRIQVNDTNISKEHCVLTRDPKTKQITLTDLSKNGTFVNGAKVGKNKQVVLNDNDKIAVIKDLNVYVFQSILTEELPITITSTSSVGSAADVTKPTNSIWGRLVSFLLHLDSFDLHEPVFKVGRSSQCDAIIDAMEIDPKIKNKFSKEHFVIHKHSDSHITVITDLSKTGTYLNGKLIGKNRRNILQHGDTIAIGPKRIKVYVYHCLSPQELNFLPPKLKLKYEVADKLGEGACGEVRLAYEKRSCEAYAIKRILKGRSTLSQLHKVNHPSKIETEIKILKSLSYSCPFIIRMKEIVETQDEVFLVLEYMKGGVLNNRIWCNEVIAETNVKFLFYQIVLAVQFLHSKGIAHRDLKPENVLLHSDEIETLVKVSDFGLSKITEDEDVMRTMCGTKAYAAPEVIDVHIVEYDMQIDVWSLGVILFYMLSKQLPFKSKSNSNTLTRLIITGSYSMDGEVWSGVSYHAKDLVRRMLTVNPKERITISEILMHPWLAKDDAVQSRVQLMLDREALCVDEAEDDIDVPAAKRARLSSSEDSA